MRLRTEVNYFMLTVHHLNNSRSQRILWLLEELGLQYEIKRYERDPETMLAPDSLKKVHPLGKSPVVTDEDKTLAESGAIIDYIVSHYGDGRLAPAANTPEALRYNYWLHYAEGSVMPLIVFDLVLGQVGKQASFFTKPLANAVTGKVKDAFVDPQTALHFSYMNDELTKATWFAGDEFTAADIQMSFPIEAASTNIENFSTEYQKLAAFLQRIRSRSAYKKALERGGEYKMLGWPNTDDGELPL